MENRLDRTGYNKKMAILRDGLSRTTELLSSSAAAYVQFQLVQYILNHGWVGVQTGNLRRSQGFEAIAPGLKLFRTDIAIAPYAVNVNMRLRAGGSMGGFNADNAPDGRTYFQIVLDRHGKEVQEKMQNEILSLIDSVNHRKPFSPRNPFPFN